MSEESHGEEPGRDRSEGPRLLLAEDNVLLGRVMARSFVRAGYTVRMVHSCADALAVTGTFHCGVFDLELGDGDGVALAAELLRRGTVGTAVFYSGNQDQPSLERASAVGAFVHKERSFEELERQVAHSIRASLGR